MGSRTNIFRKLILICIIASSFGFYFNVSHGADGTQCNPSQVIKNGTLDPNCAPDNLIIPEVGNPTSEDYKIKTTDNEKGIRNLIINILTNNIFPLVLIASVVFIVYAGFKMATSLGNQDGFNKARDFAINVIYGFLAVVLSYGAITVVLRLIFERI